MSTAVEVEASSDADAPSTDSAASSTDSASLGDDNNVTSGSDASFDSSSQEASESESNPDSDISDGSSSTPPEPRARFQGSKTKWLRLTRTERELAASLDALDADDLSIHLYNTHALKKRLRPAPNAQGHIKQTDRKNRWISESNKDQWVPRARWSAWPLPAERVPRPWENFSRRREGFAEDPDAIKPPRKRQATSSDELEECLVAETLRQAREQFYATRVPAPLQPPETEEPARKMRKTRSGKHALFAPTDLHEGVSVDAGITMDEEEAKQLMRPATRLIMGKMDELLRALHHSRHNHVYRDPRDYGSEVEEPGSTSADGSTRASSLSRKSRRTEAGVEWALSRTHLRDWSEVLGTASITGWDQNVVQRAAARCSELFGESMTFSTSRKKSTQAPNTKKPMPGPEQPAADSDGQENPSTGSASPVPHVLWEPGVGPLVCPIRSCKHYKKNFRTNAEIRAHMKQVHGFDASQYEVIHAHEGYVPSESSGDEMHEGVHVDGFLKPIKMRTEWFRKYYKRAPKGSGGAHSKRQKLLDNLQAPGNTGQDDTHTADQNVSRQQPESGDAMSNEEDEAGDDMETGDSGERDDDDTSENVASQDDATSDQDRDSGRTADDSTSNGSMDDDDETSVSANSG